MKKHVAWEDTVCRGRMTGLSTAGDGFSGGG